jgi:hypothetical protein
MGMGQWGIVILLLVFCFLFLISVCFQMADNDSVRYGVAYALGNLGTLRGVLDICIDGLNEVTAETRG